MRTRHRIPTIFNLSMVDVLCCALGCVILLWLVNFREAKRRTLAAGETTTQLVDARRRLAAAEDELADLKTQRDVALAQVAATTKERDRGRAQLADLDKQLSALRSSAAALEDRLAKRTQDYQAVAKQMAATEKDRLALQRLLREQDTLTRAAARTADDLAERLRDAEARAKKLQALADGLAGDATGAKTRIAALEKDLKQAKMQLDLSRSTTEALQDEKKLLTAQVTRARAEAENRFAGIALTGRRVVFLVDMSGSMEYVDEQTQAPDKWTGVRDTLVKIARSLPELEKFQVILFARETSFLLGNDGRWMNFDRQTSVTQISKALTATKPKGATNMYAAFEAAFRFRAQGLDTIYVLSDGLPNVGPGLTAEQMKMEETRKAQLLGGQVRKKLLTDWNRPALDKTRVRINTVGFFYESPDVGAFLWALARENDGSFVGMSKP